MPWTGSVSLSAQVPETLNALVDLRPRGALKYGHILSLTRHPAGPRVSLPVRSLSLPKKLPFAATELGVLWKGSKVPPSIRTSRNGVSWTGWTEVHEDLDMADPETGTRYSSLSAGRRARFVQVRHPQAGNLDLLKVAALNTTDGPRRRVRATRSASAAPAGPHVISRAEWGADEALKTASGRFSRVRRIFLHHTNTPNNDADPAGTIRAIYSYHVKTRGYHDIAYNFLIDNQGRIYEGRYSRPAGRGEMPSGEDPNGLAVLGAHTKDHNAGSIGIAMVGNSMSMAPGKGAMDSLVSLSAWAADRHGIDPLGKHLRMDPVSGQSRTLPNIAGHKDSGASVTDCPGVLLHAQLPEIRRRIEETIAAAAPLRPPSMPTGTTLDSASPSSSMTPNATGDVSRSAVRVQLIFEKNGGGGRTVSVTPQGGSYFVTDASYGGDPLVPGVYSIRAIAFDAQGRPSPQAHVADGYELRRPSVLPALNEMVRSVLDPPLERGESSSLAGTMETVIKVLGL